MAVPCPTVFSLIPGVALALLSAVALPEPEPASPRKDEKPDKLWVFIGTYTDGPSKGIYRCELDLATGKLESRGLAAETPNPSFLALHPNRRFLYAVSEVGDFNGKKSGAVSAFSLDVKSGELVFLNRQSSGGSGPCHLVVDRKGKHVLAANYGSGSACVLPIGEDGRLSEASDIVQHRGSSVNPQRQKEPHAHSINLDPANWFAFVADLGLDKIMVYRYDATAGKVTPNEPPAADVAPGSGPRHFAFHPSGRYAYVINELKSTVTAFNYDADRGVLKTLQTVSTLPKDFKGDSWTAEVQVHPSGKFLYGSNRGHNSIAVFTIDPQTGELTPAGFQSYQIKTPRNFGIDPTGAYLLVGSQDSDRVIVFRIDPDSGALTPTGSAVDVPKPVCVKMVAQGR